MKQKLLNESKSLGFELDQDSSEKWVIKGYRNQKKWLIQEKEEDRWLITINGNPQMLIITRIAISIISNYIDKL